MKRSLHSYTSFTRNERIGLLGLSALLLALVMVRATMSLWVHPVIDTAQQNKLAAAWQTFKRSQPTKDAAGQIMQKKEFQDASDEQTAILPDTVNINTADSATLVRLKGIGPVTAHHIISKRAVTPFTNINQLQETGAFSKATLEVLQRHITFATTPAH